MDMKLIVEALKTGEVSSIGKFGYTLQTVGEHRAEHTGEYRKGVDKRATSSKKPEGSNCCENGEIESGDCEEFHHSLFVGSFADQILISMRDCVKEKVGEETDYKSNPWIWYGLSDCGGDSGVDGEEHELRIMNEELGIFIAGARLELATFAL